MREEQDANATLKNLTMPEIAKKVSLPKPLILLRELIAIGLWGLSFVQLLVYDIGSDLVSFIPELEIVARYRFLIALFSISVVWMLLGNRRFAVFFGYIIAYPLVILLWKLPRLAFRNWVLIIAFFPAIHSIFTTFKRNFLFFILALISFFVIYLATSPQFMVLGMVYLLGYLGIHFVRRFRMAYSPSTVFADVGKVIRKAWDNIQDADFAKIPEGLDPHSDEYKQKFGQNLLGIFVVTSLLHYFGERLREVVKSRKLDLYFLSSLMYTFVLTTFVFAIEYFGLERLFPGSFSGVLDSNYFQFLGFSFGTLMTADIAMMRPETGLALALTYLQLFTSLLIIVLLVFVILTSIRERYKQDLDNVVTDLGETSVRLSKIIESNYELTIAGAEAWLLEFNPHVTKWFLKLRYGEKYVLDLEAEFNRQITGEPEQQGAGRHLPSVSESMGPS